MQRSRCRFCCLVNPPNDWFSAVHDRITSSIEVNLRRHSCDRHRGWLDHPHLDGNNRLIDTSKIFILSPEIPHEISKYFDCNPSKDVRSIFLDLSQAFDSIQRIGIICNSLKLNENFLSGRFQGKVLNGQ